MSNRTWIIEEDVPLRGPWNRETRESPVEPDIPVTGPWDRDSGSRDHRQKEVEVKEKPPVAREEDLEVTISLPPKPEVPRPEKREKEKDNVQEEDRTKRERIIHRPERKSPKKSIHFLDSYFKDRHALAASVVISEILNRRGGIQGRYRR